MKSSERKDSQQQQPQQQPSSDRQQQQQGGEQRQGGGQYGEGNYEAARQYNEGVKEHMEKHDIEREARDAAPRSDEEARDMQRAEEEGKRHAKDGGSK